jgi:hypothetical protein
MKDHLCKDALKNVETLTSSIVESVISSIPTIVGRFHYMISYHGLKYLYEQATRKRGQKGGRREKICQPILIATTQYLRNNPKIINETNNRIAEIFKEKVKKENLIIVDYNGCEWDFYFYDDLFWAIPDTKNHTKNRDISIKIGTLRKTYIPKAKEMI